MSNSEKKLRTDCPEMSEQQIIKMAKYECLYNKYFKAILKYISSKTDPQTAEDIAQETFLKALNAINDYEDRGYPFSAWLYTIARNIFTNHYRRDVVKKNTRPMADYESIQIPGEDIIDCLLRISKVVEPISSGKQLSVSTNRLEAKYNMEVLEKLIKQLKNKRQQLLALKLKGKSNKEIGVIMNLSEGAVKSLYYRTLVELKELSIEYSRQDLF